MKLFMPVLWPLVVVVYGLKYLLSTFAEVNYDYLIVALLGYLIWGVALMDKKSE